MSDPNAAARRPERLDSWKEIAAYLRRDDITSEDQLVRVPTDAQRHKPDLSRRQILFKLPPVPRHMRVYDVGADNRLLVNALSTTDTPGTIAVTTRWAVRHPRN